MIRFYQPEGSMEAAGVAQAMPSKYESLSSTPVSPKNKIKSNS
jgi:hypothetical protein